jgi:hypothetical protein
MKNIITLLFLASTLFFASCDKDNELPDKPSGNEVFIQIQALEVSENGETAVTRSALQGKKEIVSTPVGGGLVMEISVEEEDSPLREESPKPLKDNAWFRVIAVEEGTNKYVSHGDFKKGETTNVNFHVPENKDYDIICFSYNNTTNTLPSFTHTRGDLLTETLTADLENLLWQTQVLQVTNTTPTLSILLKHKLSRIKVAINCNYNAWKITSIGNTMTLSSLALVQSLDLVEGTLTAASAATQPVKWSISENKTEQVSNPFLVLPEANNTTFTLTIPTEIIGREDLQAIPTEAGYTGSFTTKLEEGHSYTLSLSLRAPKWAGSNIYWNGTALTFDLHGSTGNQGYQGVFFKFGSLVGISPAKTSGSNNFSSTDTPIYTVTSSTPTHSSWSTIPYCSSGDIGDDDTTSGTGDICRYLSDGDYRQALVSESGTAYSDNFNISTYVSGGWIKRGDYSPPTNTDAAGTTDLLKKSGNSDDKIFGSAFNRTMNVTLPASGHRSGDSNNGLLAGVGSSGNYGLGALLSDNVNRSYVTFWTNNFHVNGGVSCDTAVSIRCVKND